MKRRVVLAAAACVINLLLLVLPLLLLRQWSAAAVWPLVAFLATATMFCLGDALASGNLATTRLRSRETTTERLALASGVTLLLIFWLSVVALATQSSQGHLLAGIALACMVLGLTMRGAAINCLGDQFRTEVVVCYRAQLVERGIFRIVRHPSEMGLLLMAIGSAAFAGSVAALILAISVLLPLSLWRVRREDAALQLAFGDQFRRFRRRVPAFLPGANLLWRCV